ncbi:hypothetical protein ACFV6F_30655 [Kitasatospora phosalacinea]|uniref:hypothetical protein n=1 Tax=Kitasatospora phosalacinea TaxID=2065 RepID=UPI0036632926
MPWTGPIAPRTDRLGAWTGGRHAVDSRNVMDCGPQLGQSVPGLLPASHCCSYLAAFCTPDPAVLVLPLRVDPGWAEWPPLELERDR